MPSGDDYRVKAADMNAKAKRERDPRARAEYENLTLAYLRLADQADKNALVDVVYETPPERPNVQQQQQQQKSQPDRSDE